MPESHQLTLDLFDSTALASGWTLDLPRAVTRTDEPVDVPTDRTASEASITEAATDASAPATRRIGHNYYLAGDRDLARGWLERARDNIAAIQLAARIEREGRPATPAEQAQLIKFVGFGASDLANGCFRRPGDSGFRAGWEAIGEELEQAVASGDYASLSRCTQYAPYTPEFVIRAIWPALEMMGFRGGSILEPGVGTGLFLSLLPEPLRARSRFTGIEYDAVTARIARLLHPEAEIRHEDFARAPLPASFDLAVGNPPFSDRIVRSDPDYRALGLRLHDFFIAKAIDRLKPGGLAAFVTSHGTMDKADPRARAHIAASADLVGAIRLPEGSFRAAAGTDVVVDVLFFRKRRPGDAPGGAAWETLAEVRAADGTPIPSGSTGISGSIRRWCWVSMTCAAASTVRRRPIPAAHRWAAWPSRMPWRAPSSACRRPSTTASPNRSTGRPATIPRRGRASAPRRTAPRSRKVATSSAPTAR